MGTALGVAVPPDRVAVPLGQPAALGLPAGHHHRGGSAPDRGWWCHQIGWRCPQANPLLSASQPVTAIGVTVHRTRGGGAPVAADQAEFCLLFFTFFTIFANVLTHQVSYHHVQVC